MPYDVVSFGETMLRLSAPRGMRLEQANTFHSYVAGSESNVLACLARFGLRCSWLSALPSNPVGRRVAYELRGHGVNLDGVVWLNDGTRLGLFYAEEMDDPLGLSVLYDRAHSACVHIDPDRINLSVLEGARLLHLTGITPALSPEANDVFMRLLHRARATQVPISFDVNYRAKLWSAEQASACIEEACRNASIVFCTQDDARELWGIVGTPEVVVRGLARRFDRIDGGMTTVLTLGRDGAAHLRGDEYQAAPAIPSNGHARFGSGDAFAAGYIYAYLEAPRIASSVSEGFDTSLLFGNVAASLKRAIDGDIATISLDDVWGQIHTTARGRFR